MKKQLLVTGLIMSLLIVTASPVWARDRDLGVNGLIRDEQRAENQASKTAERSADQLSNLKKRADQMINNRISELNRLLNRVNGDSRLSSDDKSSLLSEIQTDISGLNSLKAKIDADSDLTTARSDAKQIVTNYRIYEFFVPKIRLLVTIDNLSALTTKLQGLTPKIQSLIDNLKNQGKDTSALQALLNDANSQLQNISSKLAADKTSVTSLTLSSTNTKSVYVSVRQDLASVRAGFAQFRHDIGQMREQFRISLKTGQASSKPTPAASAVSSPTP